MTAERVKAQEAKHGSAREKPFVASNETTSTSTLTKNTHVSVRPNLQAPDVIEAQHRIRMIVREHDGVHPWDVMPATDKRGWFAWGREEANGIQ